MNVKNRMARVFAAFVALVAMTLGGFANAQTDISSVITTLDGYRTAALAVGIAILLYVLGRTVVRKIAK